MAERRLSPPNPNEVTIAKSFRRALMFFRVFIMTRSADDVSHRTFYSWKWRKLPQTPTNARQSLNRPQLKLFPISFGANLFDLGTNSSPRNKTASISAELSSVPAHRNRLVRRISTLFLCWSWPCVKHQFRWYAGSASSFARISRRNWTIDFLVGSSRVVRNLADLNCYKGSFVFSAVNFYGREEGVESWEPGD